MHSHFNVFSGRKAVALAAVFALAILSGSTVSAQFRGRGAALTVYDNPDFRGSSATFGNEIADMREYSLNDRITSLRIDNGQAWEVCQDINFGGRCRVFSASVPDLREAGWNDRISSVRPVGYARGNNSGGNNSGWGNTGWGNNNTRLVFFDKTNYRGSSRDFSGNSNLGGFSNDARSVEVYGGMWELCDRRSGNGLCVTVRDSVPDLRRLGFRNGVSYVRELNDRRRF
jgi:hypothetical protein